MSSRFLRGPAEGIHHPPVSVVVPVRNRCNITLRFLGDLVSQTYSNIRIFVIDSNSNDGTVAAIKSHYPSVQIISAGDDDYWAGATNLGVLEALKGDSEWLFTVNDDAALRPDHIERLVAIAQANGCKILGSQINYLDDPGRIWALGTFTRWGSAEFLRLGFHNQLNEQRPSNVAFAAVLRVDALPGNGVLIHHSVFRQVGIYNHRFLPHYHADSELVMRAVASGFHAWVTPQLILLNDFRVEQKRLPGNTVKGLAWTLGHPKSYLFLSPLLYIFWVYCPLPKKPATAASLLCRLFRILR